MDAVTIRNVQIMHERIQRMAYINQLTDKPVLRDFPLPDELLLLVLNYLFLQQCCLYDLLFVNRRFYRIIQQKLLRVVRLDTNLHRNRFGKFLESTIPRKTAEVRVVQCTDVDSETIAEELSSFRLLSNLHTLQLTGKLHLLALPPLSSSLRRLELWHKPSHQAPDFCLASITNVVPHIGLLENLEELVTESIAFTNIAAHTVPKKINLKRLHMEYRCFTNPPLDIADFFSVLAESVESIEFKSVSPHVVHICPDLTRLLSNFSESVTSFKFASWDSFPQIPHIPKLNRLALLRNSQSDFNGVVDLVEFFNLIPTLCEFTELEYLHITHDFMITTLPNEDPRFRLKSLCLDHVALDYEACRILFKPSSESLRELSFSISSFGENYNDCYSFLGFFQNSVHKIAILTFRSPGVAKSFEAPSTHEKKILEQLAGFKRLKMLLYRTLRPDQFFGDVTCETLPTFSNLKYLSLFARSVHGRQSEFVSNLLNTFALAVEGGFFPALKGFACWGWEDRRFPAFREFFQTRDIKISAVSRKRVRSDWDEWERQVEAQFDLPQEPIS